MQFLVFQLRRLLIFLADLVITPVQSIGELWRDPTRGRFLIFGMPAVLFAMTAIIAWIVALSSQQQFLKNYERAEKAAVANGNWEEAIIYQSKVTQLEYGADKQRYKLAGILRRDNRPETAEANNNKANSILASLAPVDRPGFALAHIWRAGELLNAARSLSRRRDIGRLLQMAEDQLRFGLEADPDEPQIKAFLAERILIPSQRYNEALDLYRDMFEKSNALSLYVKVVELCDKTGRVELQNETLNKAIAGYKKLITDEGPKTLYIVRLAIAHGLKNEFEKSFGLLNQHLDATEPGPAGDQRRKTLENALARVHLAQAHLFWNEDRQKEDLTETEKIDRHIRSLKIAYDLNPENENIRNRLTEIGFGPFDDSINFRAREIYDPRDNPKSASAAALRIVGTFELTRGDQAKGIQLLEACVKKNPGDHAALNNMAFTIMSVDTRRALDLSNRAIALERNSPSYHDTRGNIYMALEEWELAVVDFETSLRLFRQRKEEPSSAGIYQALAKCYRQQGMFSSAERYEKKLIEIRPTGGGTKRPPTSQR